VILSVQTLCVGQLAYSSQYINCVKFHSIWKHARWIIELGAFAGKNQDQDISEVNLKIPISAMLNVQKLNFGQLAWSSMYVNCLKFNSIWKHARWIIGLGAFSARTRIYISEVNLKIRISAKLNVQKLNFGQLAWSSMYVNCLKYNSIESNARWIVGLWAISAKTRITIFRPLIWSYLSQRYCACKS